MRKMKRRGAGGERKGEERRREEKRRRGGESLKNGQKAKIYRQEDKKLTR